MDGWDMLVAKDDLRRTQVAPSDAATRELAEGEALLEVESFALTANNVTYGALGDAFGYWKFFPAPEGWGRIPVWGFAKVVRSRASDAPEGLRLFGYWPMSSHHVARLQKTPTGVADTSPHRAELPPTYNAYTPAPGDALDDYRSLLRPLFTTGWLIDDQLSEDPSVKALVLSSASSKTAMSLAWCARRRGLKVVGLTSAGSVELLNGLGLYDEVLPYEAAGQLAAEGPTVYVDFAARADVTLAVHRALGPALVRSVIVGLTHWESADPGAPPPDVGPAPAVFFAPDQIQKRLKEWGLAAFQQRYDEALRGFVADATWLKLRHRRGVEALQALYADVLEGRVRPDEGHIVSPR
ncbi:DUF2855 family protein [Phenylobacterium terrae]|uniref:DUF2855 family protein n=1 Tax=Phenylobacterium terrae TaxID=2665495 RepID=A0ABW4MXV4_9CAUL